MVRSFGVPTPDFAVVDAPADVAAVDLPFPLFAKPLAEGTGKGIDARSKIDSPRQLAAVCGELLARFRQPVLVETYLPGREFTVGIVGSGAEAEAVGVMEVVLKPEAEANAYSYVNKEKCEELVDYALAPAAEARGLPRRWPCGPGAGWAASTAAASTSRWTGDGVVNFIEVNPLAGLHPDALRPADHLPPAGHLLPGR